MGFQVILPYFNPAAPGPIGGTTPAAVTGTTVTATTNVVTPLVNGNVPAPVGLTIALSKNLQPR